MNLGLRGPHKSTHAVFCTPSQGTSKIVWGSIHSWFKHVTNRPKWRLMPPNRRFWKDEQKMKCRFSVDFSMARSPKSSNNALQKGPRNPAFHILFILPKSSFGWLTIVSTHACSYASLSRGLTSRKFCSPRCVLGLFCKPILAILLQRKH